MAAIIIDDNNLQTISVIGGDQYGATAFYTGGTSWTSVSFLHLTTNQSFARLYSDIHQIIVCGVITNYSNGPFDDIWHYVSCSIRLVIHTPPFIFISY
jgi:hypothetical protein